MGNDDRRGGRREAAARLTNHIRHERLESLMCEELNSIFDGEIANPLLANVRITHVELARDGSRARLWYTMMDNEQIQRDTIAAALARTAPFLRARLCEAMELKRIPELRFAYDFAAYLRDPENGEDL